MIGVFYMDKRTDMRTMRTQKYLRRALFELIGEKGASNVTVKELTERAEVSRSTFYLYYDSIQGMIQSISDESRAAYAENAERILSLDLSFRESCIELIRHPFSTEEDLITFVELIRSRVITWSMVVEAIYAVKDEFLRTFTGSRDEWTLDYTFHFIASGIAETIMKWVEDTSDKRSYSDVAELIIEILYQSNEHFSEISRR